MTTAWRDVLIFLAVFGVFVLIIDALTGQPGVYGWAVVVCVSPLLVALANQFTARREQNERGADRS